MQGIVRVNKPRPIADGVNHLQQQAVYAFINQFTTDRIFDIEIPKDYGIAYPKILEYLILIFNLDFDDATERALIDIQQHLFFARRDIASGRSTTRGLIARQYPQRKRSGETREEYSKRISKLLSTYHRLCSRFEINDYFGRSRKRTTCKHIDFRIIQLLRNEVRQHETQNEV